jgi:hypothetical protein
VQPAEKAINQHASCARNEGDLRMMCLLLTAVSVDSTTRCLSPRSFAAFVQSLSEWSLPEKKNCTQAFQCVLDSGVNGPVSRNLLIASSICKFLSGDFLVGHFRERGYPVDKVAVWPE